MKNKEDNSNIFCNLPMHIPNTKINVFLRIISDR